MRAVALASAALAAVLKPGAPAAASTHVALRAALKVSTQGCAGFEFFRIGSDAYLAAANFWDGASSDMSADSIIYRVRHDAGGALALAEVQRFRTRGAHGADFFTNPATGAAYLVVPEYYACGSARGPARNASCASTMVLRWDAAARRFAQSARLRTAGPAQTDHYVARDGTVFIVVGENFNDEVCFYRLVTAAGGAEKWDAGPCVPVPGAGGVALAEAGDTLLLVAASYHDGATGWATRSRVFAADARAPGAAARAPAFAEVDLLSTAGAHDAELGAAGGATLLVLAEERDAGSARVTSAVLELDAAAARFAPVQALPSDGAHAAEVFEGPDGAAYIMLANFGDRHGGRTAARSELWRRGAGAGARFELAAGVDSHGATDAEHFELDGRRYVALSEEGDVGQRAHQVSTIYELVFEARGADL